MNKKPDSMVYIVALGVLIVVGIITTSIINVVKNNQGEADIRAKAGTLNTLKFTGIVAEVNDADGILLVGDVQFDATSRSGDAVNYGLWSVTPPASFDIYTIDIGTRINFTVASNTFNIASKAVNAVQITDAK